MDKTEEERIAILLDYCLRGYYFLTIQLIEQDKVFYSKKIFKSIAVLSNIIKSQNFKLLQYFFTNSLVDKLMLGKLSNEILAVKRKDMRQYLISKLNPYNNWFCYYTIISEVILKDDFNELKEIIANGQEFFVNHFDIAVTVVQMGNLNMLKLMLNDPMLKIDINDCNGKLLLDAINNEHIDIVDYLLTDKTLKENALIHIQNDQALVNACNVGSVKIVDYLTNQKNENYINFNSRNYEGLCVAVKLKHQLLLEHLILNEIIIIDEKIIEEISYLDGFDIVQQILEKKKDYFLLKNISNPLIKKKGKTKL